MSGTIRIGTSGWQYDDWDGAFYPDDVPRSRWFEHYASVFDTVEINYSFYRLPRESTVEKWHDRAPPGFRFAIKGSRYITHNLKLGDGTEEAIGNVAGRLAPLKTFLGVWLWQLPPSLHKDTERLDRFLRLLPRRNHAIEFRHPSWYDDEVEDVLSRRQAAWVWLSDRQMPDRFPVTASFVYARFHGLSDDEDERYRYDYSRQELEPWAERLRAAADDGVDAWVYFNNDHAAKAPANARLLRELTEDG